MWVKVVEHDYKSGTRLDEILVNLDNVSHINTRKNQVCLNSGLVIRINKESMIHLLELIEIK